MRVLSIDPALRNTGYAVIERRLKTGRTPTYKVVTYGVIENGRKLRQSGCLLAIHEQLRDVIQNHKPEVCAVEGVIYVQSFKTAITMGAARGAAVDEDLLGVREVLLHVVQDERRVVRAGLVEARALAAALEVFEYAPKRVKQAVVGKGAADKQQVAFMIRALLGLTETPPHDAADALAIGLAHFYEQDPTRVSRLADKPAAI